MKPLSRNSGAGSTATMSPTSMPRWRDVGGGARHGVDPQLDIGPADGKLVDLVVEGVAGRLQRQDGAAEGAALGEDGHPRAFGEARRPVADRHQLQPAVVLDQLDLGAERIEVRDDGARRLVLLARQEGPDAAAAGDLEVDAEPVEFAAAFAHDRVGVAGRARYLEKLREPLRQVVRVDGQPRHDLPPRFRRRLCAPPSVSIAERGSRRNARPSAADRDWPAPAARSPR